MLQFMLKQYSKILAFLIDRILGSLARKFVFVFSYGNVFEVTLKSEDCVKILVNRKFVKTDEVN